MERSQILRDWEAVFRPEMDVVLSQNLSKAFEQPKEGFQLAEAEVLAQLCHLVYIREPCQRASLLGETGVRETATFTYKELHWSLFQTSDEDAPTLLCFRGTSDIRHWLLNIDAKLVRHELGGRVHSGFQTAFDHLKESLTPHLQPIRKRPLVVGGHSLGGAVALLAGSALKAEKVYTFGCPRIGNTEMTTALEERTKVYRVIHQEDMVTTLPHEIGLTEEVTFRHVGNPICVSGKGVIKDTQPTAIDLWKGSLQHLIGPSKVLAPMPALLDHAPRGYVKALAAARNEN